MSDYVKIKRSLLTGIADAIRLKFALGGSYTPAKMADIINNIVVDGSSINENKFITGVWTEYSDDDVLEIATGTFNNSKNLVSVSFPNVQKISGYGSFYGCTILESVNLPALSSITGLYAFCNCRALTTISLPELAEIRGGTSFDGCAALTIVDMPKLASITASNVFARCTSLQTISLQKLVTISSYTFQNCTSLTSVDLPMLTNLAPYVFIGCTSLTKLDLPMLSNIENYGLYNATALNTLILRNETMCTLGSSSPLYGTPIASGTGYVYVPSALVDTYKADSNWSTFAAQIRAIEDYPDICGTT